MDEDDELLAERIIDKMYEDLFNTQVEEEQKKRDRIKKKLQKVVDDFENNA